MVSGQPVICGGYNLYENEYLQDCVILGQPNDKMKLLQKRTGAGSVVLDHETLWVVGGETGMEDLKSTEYISLHKPSVEGPLLPFSVER